MPYILSFIICFLSIFLTRIQGLWGQDFLGLLTAVSSELIKMPGFSMHPAKISWWKEAKRRERRKEKGRKACSLSRGKRDWWGRPAAYFMEPLVFTCLSPRLLSKKELSLLIYPPPSHFLYSFVVVMLMMSRKSTRVMESQEKEKWRKGGRAKGKNMSLVRRVLNIIYGFKKHLHHSLAVWLYTSHFLSPGLMVKLVQGTLLLLPISAPVSFYSLNLDMTSEYHSTWQSRSHNWDNTTTTFGLDYLSGDFQFSLLCFKFWKGGVWRMR